MGCPTPVPLCDDVFIRIRCTNKSRRSWTELAGSSAVNTDQHADGADGKNSQQGHGNSPSWQRGRAPQGPIYLRTFKYFLTALHSCNLAAPRQRAAGLGSLSAGGAKKQSRTALHANRPLLQSPFQLIFPPPSHFFFVWFLGMLAAEKCYSPNQCQSEEYFSFFTGGCIVWNEGANPAGGLVSSDAPAWEHTHFSV